MADGEQVLSTAISASSQVAVEAMKLLATAIGKVLEEYFVRRNSAEYRRQIELMRQAKVTTQREQGAVLLNKLENASSGYLSPRQFLKAQELGMEFVGVPITMSKQDVKEFAKIAEKNGVLFTAVAHPDYNGKNPTYYMAVREKDLPKIEEAVSILKFERRVKNIDVEISKANKEIKRFENENSELNEYIDAKSKIVDSELTDGLSDKGIVALEKKADSLERKYGISDIGEAQKRIEKNTYLIYKNETVVSSLEKEKTKTLLERRKAEAVLCRTVVQEQAFENKSSERKGTDLNKSNSVSRNGVTADFNSAVNRDTSGSNQRIVYICDTANPDHYIVAESKQATFEGKSYLKTEYTVYDGGKNVMVRDDSRSRGENYQSWVNTRKDLRNSLNFSNNVIVFNSKEDLTDYQSRCRGAKAIIEQEKGSAAVININEQADGKIAYRDYDTIIGNLKDNLAKRGYSLEQGEREPINIETGKTASQVRDEYYGVNADICQNAAVCEVLSDQIYFYSKLSSIEARMVELELGLMSYPETSAERKEAMSEMEQLKIDHDKWCGIENAIIEKRASLENANVAVTMYEEKERSIEEKSLANEHDTDISVSDRDVGKGEKSANFERIKNASDGMSIDEAQDYYTKKSVALKAEQVTTGEKVLPTKKEH